MISLYFQVCKSSAHKIESSLIIILNLQYGGNPVSCAIAIAVSGFVNSVFLLTFIQTSPFSWIMIFQVMDAIEKDGLREKSTRVGNYLVNSLTKLMDKHPIIGIYFLNIWDTFLIGIYIMFSLICQVTFVASVYSWGSTWFEIVKLENQPLPKRNT